MIVPTTRDDLTVGAFLAADRYGLTLGRGDRIAQIPIDEIVEVRASERRVGSGIGIGAAIAGSVAFGLIVAKGGSGDENGFYAAVGLAPFITGAGIGIGAAIGAQPSTRVVYHVP